MYHYLMCENICLKARTHQHFKGHNQDKSMISGFSCGDKANLYKSFIGRLARSERFEALQELLLTDIMQGLRIKCQGE